MKSKIKLVVALIIATILVSSVLTPAFAQGTLKPITQAEFFAITDFSWKTVQPWDGGFVVTTPTQSHLYDSAWVVDYTSTFTMTYTVENGQLKVVRDNNYGLGSLLSLSTDPVPVTGGTKFAFATWVGTADGDIAKLSSLMVNGITSVPVSALANASSMYSGWAYDHGSPVSMVQLKYDLTIAGPVSSGQFGVTMFATVPEPAIGNITVMGLLILATLRFRK